MQPGNLASEDDHYVVSLALVELRPLPNATHRHAWFCAKPQCSVPWRNFMAFHACRAGLPSAFWPSSSPRWRGSPAACTTAHWCAHPWLRVAKHAGRTLQLTAVTALQPCLICRTDDATSSSGLCLTVDPRRHLRLVIGAPYHLRKALRS